MSTDTEHKHAAAPDEGEQPEPPRPPGDEAPRSVLRQLAARLFGFDREIRALHEHIRGLSWDTAFGMWTRGAFLQFCQIMPRGTRTIVFLDLDHMHVPHHETTSPIAQKQNPSTPIPPPRIN